MHSIRIESAAGFRSSSRAAAAAPFRRERVGSREQHAAWTRFVTLMRSGRRASGSTGSDEDLRARPHRDLPLPLL